MPVIVKTFVLPGLRSGSFFALEAVRAMVPSKRVPAAKERF